MSHATVSPSHSRPTKLSFFLELLFAVIITHIPFISIPFKWFETYFHEISHGLATLITGGSISHIQLLANGAGFCYSLGGNAVVIAFSGYFGAALWGYLLYLMATQRRFVRFTLVCLLVALVASLLLWARDVLTILILISLIGIILLPLKLKNSRPLTLLLRILALVVIVNAMGSPLVLLGLAGQGDAVMLSELTWIPAIIWVAIWIALSCSMLWLCFKQVRKS